MRGGWLRPVGFVLTVSAGYLILMIPALGLDQLFAVVCRNIGEMVGWAMGLGTTILIEPLAGSQPKFDSVIKIFRVPETSAVLIPFNMKFLCYSPIVLFLAIVVASPVSWKQRGRALLLGTPILSVFIALRVALLALTVLVKKGDLESVIQSQFWSTMFWIVRLSSDSPAWDYVLTVGADIFCQATMSSLIAPVLIWALVMFSKRDLVMLKR